MFNNNLWYWDSFIAVVLHTRYREEVFYDYPTCWKYEKWVFEISYTDSTEQIKPAIQSPIEIINDYFFAWIITEVYLNIASNTDWEEKELIIKQGDLEKIRKSKHNNLFSTSIIDTKKYNERDYSIYTQIRIDEEKLKDRMEQIMMYWKERKYSFYPYKNAIRIDRQVGIVVNYLVEKLNKYEPDHLYVSLAEIYNIVPELKEDEDWDEYYIYRYFDNEHFDAVCCLYFLDKIGAIYIESWFFWFWDDEAIFFKISILDKFFELFEDSRVDDAVLQILIEEWVTIRWKINKDNSSDAERYEEKNGIFYDDSLGVLFLNWKSKKLLQKQKILVEWLFDLMDKRKDGWVSLEELAIYDDHSFIHLLESDKERIIKNFYNTGNHLNKTIKLETWIDKLLELSTHSMRINPAYKNSLIS